MTEYADGRRIARVRRASRARIARRARARGARRVMANVLVVDLASPASEDDGAVVVVDAPGTTARRARGRGSADVVLVDERAVTPGRASGRVGKRARASGDAVGGSGRCGVCLEAWRLPTATRCGHVFCARCLGTAMRHGSTCPTCRKKVTKASCVRVYL